MTIYEKNIQSKEKSLAMIAEPFEDSTEPSLNYPIVIENLESKSGLITSRIRAKQDAPLIFIHSAYDPIHEAKLKVDSLDFSKNTFIIVYGIGLGYHLFELRKKISRNSRVVVIENSHDVYKNLMNNIDMRELFADQRFSFVIDLNLEKLSYFFMRILRKPDTFFISSNMQFLTLNYYDKLFPGVAREITKIATSKIKNYWHSLGNDVGDTLIGLVQNFKNIDEAINNTGIKDIKDMYKDKPAIVVSAGPSLDKNIDLLKEVEGKALILATDATLRGLIRKGIKPDAVLSLERILVYEQLLKNRDFEIPNDVVFAGPPLLEPEVFREFKNNKKVICFKAGESINEWINDCVGDKGYIAMSNNVGGTVFGFALELGANPIILIGQDLAFSETGETHGKEIDETVRKLSKKVYSTDDAIYLKGWNGQMVKSTILWETFLTGFENKIHEYPDRTFIDATEGGAYINGTQTMTLRETIDKYISSQKIKRLYEVVPEIENIDKDVKIKYYNALLESTEDLLYRFRKIQVISKKRLKALNKIKNKYGDQYINMSPSENKEVCKQLMKTDELSKLMMSGYVTMLFFQGLVSSIIYEVNEIGLELSNENVWKNLLAQEDFLQVSIVSTAATIPCFKDIKAYLKAKVDKYPEDVDVNEYIKFSYSIAMPK